MQQTRGPSDINIQRDCMQLCRCVPINGDDQQRRIFGSETYAQDIGPSDSSSLRTSEINSAPLPLEPGPASVLRPHSLENRKTLEPPKHEAPHHAPARNFELICEDYDIDDYPYVGDSTSCRDIMGCEGRHMRQIRGPPNETVERACSRRCICVALNDAGVFWARRHGPTGGERRSRPRWANLNARTIATLPSNRTLDEISQETNARDSSSVTDTQNTTSIIRPRTKKRTEVICNLVELLDDYPAPGNVSTCEQVFTCVRNELTLVVRPSQELPNNVQQDLIVHVQSICDAGCACLTKAGADHWNRRPGWGSILPYGSVHDPQYLYARSISSSGGSTASGSANKDIPRRFPPAPYAYLHTDRDTLICSMMAVIPDSHHMGIHDTCEGILKCKSGIMSRREAPIGGEIPQPCMRYCACVSKAGAKRWGLRHGWVAAIPPPSETHNKVSSRSTPAEPSLTFLICNVHPSFRDRPYPGNITSCENIMGCEESQVTCVAGPFDAHMERICDEVCRCVGKKGLVGWQRRHGTRGSPGNVHHSFYGRSILARNTDESRSKLAAVETSRRYGISPPPDGPTAIHNAKIYPRTPLAKKTDIFPRKNHLICDVSTIRDFPTRGESAECIDVMSCEEGRLLLMGRASSESIERIEQYCGLYCRCATAGGAGRWGRRQGWNRTSSPRDSVHHSIYARSPLAKTTPTSPGTNSLICRASFVIDFPNEGDRPSCEDIMACEEGRLKLTRKGPSRLIEDVAQGQCETDCKCVSHAGARRWGVRYGWVGLHPPPGAIHNPIYARSPAPVPKVKIVETEMPNVLMCTFFIIRYFPTAARSSTCDELMVCEEGRLVQRMGPRNDDVLRICSDHCRCITEGEAIRRAANAPNSRAEGRYIHVHGQGPRPWPGGAGRYHNRRAVSTQGTAPRNTKPQDSHANIHRRSPLARDYVEPLQLYHLQCGQSSITDYPRTGENSMCQDIMGCREASVIHLHGPRDTFPWIPCIPCMRSCDCLWGRQAADARPTPLQNRNIHDHNPTLRPRSPVAEDADERPRPHHLQCAEYSIASYPRAGESSTCQDIMGCRGEMVIQKHDPRQNIVWLLCLRHCECVHEQQAVDARTTVPQTQHPTLRPRSALAKEIDDHSQPYHLRCAEYFIPNYPLPGEISMCRDIMGCLGAEVIHNHGPANNQAWRPCISRCTCESARDVAMRFDPGAPGRGLALPQSALRLSVSTGNINTRPAESVRRGSVNGHGDSAFFSEDRTVRGGLAKRNPTPPSSPHPLRPRSPSPKETSTTLPPLSLSPTTFEPTRATTHDLHCVYYAIYMYRHIGRECSAFMGCFQGRVVQKHGPESFFVKDRCVGMCRCAGPPGGRGTRAPVVGAAGAGRGGRRGGVGRGMVRGEGAGMGSAGREAEGGLSAGSSGGAGNGAGRGGAAGSEGSTELRGGGIVGDEHRWRGLWSSRMQMR